MIHINSYLKKITRINILVVLMIFFSVVGLHIYENMFQNLYVENSTLLNLLGRQRMLAQKGAKVFVLLDTRNKKYDKNKLIKELIETLDQLILMHNAFRVGNKHLEIKPLNSKTIKTLLGKSEKELAIMTAAYHSVVKEYKHSAAIKSPGDDREYQFMIACDNYTILMDKIVNIYENETHGNIHQHWLYEIIEISIIMMILLLTGYFGFRRVIRNILLEISGKY